MMQATPQKPRGMPVWLVVLIAVGALAFVIIAILGTLAFVGFRRYMTLAKSSEALTNVRHIASEASTTYASKRSLCDSATSPVPASIHDVAGKKYLSKPSDWQADAKKDAGFSCLSFEISHPQFYQYDYQRAASGNAFTALAHGDLDGDGVTSEFSLGGKVVGSAVLVDPNPTQTNPSE